MNQLKAGAVLSYVIIGLNNLVGLLYTPFMLRCLGQNQYGLYSLVASVIAYLTLLDFGFGNAIVRYTAKFRAEGKNKEMWEMFGMFLIVYSVIGLLAFCGGLGLYFNIDTLFDRTMTSDELSQARVMMLLLTVNLAITFPMSIFGAIITAHEKFIFQRIVSILQILLSTAVLVVLLYIGYKAIALVLVHTVFNILVLGLNYIYCKKKLKIKLLFSNFDFSFLKEITTYSFWIFLNAIMDRIYWGTGQFVLGAVSGTVAVAIFSVAISLQGMYMSFSTSISNVLLPKLTKMVANRYTEEEFSNLFVRTGRLQCIVLALVLSGFIVFGRSFIELWAGVDYGTSYIIVLIFFIALFIPLVQNTGIIILQARNQMKFRSLLYLAISMLSVVFQIILSQKYGAVGCACAIGGALLLGQGLVMNIYYSRFQGINIALFWHQLATILFPTAILTCVGVFIGHYVDYSNPYVLVAGIMMFVTLYAFVLWNFSLNVYEKNILLGIKRVVSHRI